MLSHSREEEEEEEEEESSLRIRLPTFPSITLLSKASGSLGASSGMLPSEYYAELKSYLEELSKLARLSGESYEAAALGEIDDEEEGEEVAIKAYEYASTYFFSNYAKPDFRRVFFYKNPKEDLVRKYNLANHVFWEICKLYSTWYDAETKRFLRSSSPSSTGPGGGERRLIERMKNDDKTLEAYGRYVVEGSPHEFSQRELNQAFFLLGGSWKTMRYSTALSRYVKALVARMCAFFCYSSTEEEMDEEKMRLPIPVSLPVVEKDDDDEKEEDDDFGERAPIQHYYPSLDYCVMSQIRFYHYVGDLKCYESRRKRSLSSTLRENLAFLYNENDSGGGVGKRKRVNAALNAVTKYDVRDWLCVELLKSQSEYACDRISPELKERTSSLYIYGCFSEADRDWLKYKNPISLPSFADEFVAKECRDAAYDEIVKKTSRSYKDIYAQESTDFCGVGFYEWCVLKNVSRIFALKFDLFEEYVFGREKIKNDPEVAFLLAAGRQEPSIVQFFSEYRVFYDGHLYVDQELEDVKADNIDRVKARLADAIYDTALLWIAIVLKDFPNSKLAKGIAETLQGKCCEDALSRLKMARFGVAGTASSSLGGGANNGNMDAQDIATLLEAMGDEAEDDVDDVVETVERKRRRMILRKELATAENITKSVARSARGSRGVDDTEARQYFSMRQRDLERTDKQNRLLGLGDDDDDDDDFTSFYFL